MDKLEMTLVLISHELPVIRQMCDRFAIMRHRAICEITATDNLFETPKYLLDLIPRMDLFGATSATEIG